MMKNNPIISKTQEWIKANEAVLRLAKQTNNISHLKELIEMCCEHNNKIIKQLIPMLEEKK